MHLFFFYILFCVVIKWIVRKIEWEVLDWIDLTQDMDKRRAFVNTGVNLEVP